MLTFSELVEYIKARRALSRFFNSPTDANFQTLSHFLNQSSAYQERLFSVKNKDHYNVLHCVVRHLPQALPSLLTVIQTLDDNTKARLFTSKILAKWMLSKEIPQRERHLYFVSDWLKEEIDKQMPSDTTAGDWNVLELAARYQPELVTPLLKVITSLNPTVQVEIFSRNNQYLNALQIAITYHPEVVKPLLKAIAKLEDTYQNQIDMNITKKEQAHVYNKFEDGKCLFEKVDIHKNSTVAARWTEEMVRSWIRIIATLSAQSRDKFRESLILFFQEALIEAVNWRPSRVESMLNAIKILGPKAQLSIVSYVNYRENVLTEAKPEAIKPLLQVIATFDRGVQANILCYASYGTNALQKNIRERKIQSVTLLLEFIATLDPKFQAKILCNNSEYGYEVNMNALQLAVYNEPRLVKPLLAAIKTLDPAIQSVIFANKNKSGDNAIAIASQHCPEFIPQLKEAEDAALKPLSKRGKAKKKPATHVEIEIQCTHAMSA